MIWKLWHALTVLGEFFLAYLALQEIIALTKWSWRRWHGYRPQPGAKPAAPTTGSGVQPRDDCTRSALPPIVCDLHSGVGWFPQEPQVCTREGDCITEHSPCNGWPRVDDMDDFHARRRAVGAE
jgi:hypothetical protein